MELKEIINLTTEHIDPRLADYTTHAFNKHYAQALHINGVSPEAFVTGMIVILDHIYKNGIPTDLEEIIHGEKV